MFKARRGAGLLAVALAMTVTIAADPALAASAAGINRNVDAALASMYASVPETCQLASRAKAVLVFPNIVKASKSGGFELGVGPSIVVLDAGTAKALTTTTTQDDIYAVFFDQKGLMAGLGLQGSKISRTEK